MKPYEGAIVLLEPNEFKEYQKIAKGKLSAKDDRPLCIAVEDPRKKGVFWAVPITKEVGTKLVHAKKAPDKFKFYKFLGKDSCFIISNMFPITDKDIKREYTKGGKPARLAQPDFEKLRDHVRKIVNNPPKWESVMSETNIKELYAYTVKKLELEKTQEKTIEPAQHDSVHKGKIMEVTNEKIFQENITAGTITEHRRDALKNISENDLGKFYSISYDHEGAINSNEMSVEPAQHSSVHKGRITETTNNKIFQENTGTGTITEHQRHAVKNIGQEDIGKFYDISYGKEGIAIVKEIPVVPAQHGKCNSGPIIEVTKNKIFQESTANGRITEHRRYAVKNIGVKDIGKTFFIQYGREGTAIAKESAISKQRDQGRRGQER